MIVNSTSEIVPDLPSLLLTAMLGGVPVLFQLIVRLIDPSGAARRWLEGFAGRNTEKPEVCPQDVTQEEEEEEEDWESSSEGSITLEERVLMTHQEEGGVKLAALLVQRIPSWEGAAIPML